jgi:hypothetical protein
MVRKHNYIPLKCAESKNISNKENKDDKEGKKIGKWKERDENL